MKQNTLRVLFFVLKSRLLKNGEAPIILRVTIDGRQDEVRIQRSVPLKLWDNVKERSKGKDRSSTELNSYIEALKVRLYQIHKELLCREALITPKNLLIKLFSKEERHLVLQTMRKCIDDWTSLIGTEYQPSTISRYNNCYESLQTVIKDFYRKEDITFHELNGEFIDRFEIRFRPGGFLLPEKSENNARNLSGIVVNVTILVRFWDAWFTPPRKAWYS